MHPLGTAGDATNCFLSEFNVHPRQKSRCSVHSAWIAIILLILQLRVGKAEFMKADVTNVDERVPFATRDE